MHFTCTIPVERVETKIPGKEAKLVNQHNALESLLSRSQGPSQGYIEGQPSSFVLSSIEQHPDGILVLDSCCAGDVASQFGDLLLRVVQPVPFPLDLILFANERARYDSGRAHDEPHQ